MRVPPQSPPVPRQGAPPGPPGGRLAPSAPPGQRPQFETCWGSGQHSNASITCNARSQMCCREADGFPYCGSAVFGCGS
ncbi:hypothetical protein [Tautonia plasticadhaerens]|uniref:Uncharacterized protein n=1 Tax=Tautonia plasticadhaerens TaxID=2527974 RepID=A0A518HE34_9BACT|nr:hypothetical protein [Tautonia plasticadhaerens]QDV38986.1 hypothetical protein ElP_69470 [Tautonia plasticadhaerens]